MAKSSAVFFCSACGAIKGKWMGKCDDCGTWNSITQETISTTPFAPASKQKKHSVVDSSMQIFSLDDEVEPISRINTSINELDRVLGGGLVPGSAILIGGDPGIGKSTLILQTAIALGNMGFHCLYISAEESIDQIKLRAKRLEQTSKNVGLVAATSFNDIAALVNKQQIQLLIIDSIQTIYHDAIESAPGSVSQVRACAFELIRMAKTKGFSLIIVGHVTKDGAIAGPKVLEHMVDTVLYFEGEKGQQFRIIRAVKNRFGPANEIGVFEMQQGGLLEVTNPSTLFLPITEEIVSGGCIFAGLEGSRPILVEVQSLVVPSFLPTPRRSVTGWDANRLAMLIAVLNSRYGVCVLDKEIYLNIAGGMKVIEPAMDLSAIASILSATLNRPLARDIIFFGEVGLSGEVRPVTGTDLRLQEAAKLGFKTAIIPAKSKIQCETFDMRLIEINHIKQLSRLFMKST